MTLERRTIIESILHMRDGTLLVRFDKQIVGDNKIRTPDWHVMSLEPGHHTEEIIAANKNHLVQMHAEPDAAELDYLATHIKFAHTPEKIAARAARRKAQEENEAGTNEKAAVQ